jgi:hypothetical protein
MAEPLAITILRRKRDEIESAITAYERRIKEAQRDLSAVNATLRLFEVNGEPSQFPVYVDLSRLFKRFEMVRLAKAALAAEGPLDTRELAVRVMRAKGLDEEDKVMRQTVAFKLVQALGIAAKHGRVGGAGRRGGVRVWKL